MNALTSSIVDLPGGPVAIRDSGGDGPMVVFVHGVLVDSRLWEGVWPAVAEVGYRCVLPDLPIGAHRHTLDADADRTPLGQARRIAALIRVLGAERAVLVGNDSGGGICQLLTADDPDVVDRLVLTPSDAFNHCPPLFFRPLVWAARSPRVLKAVVWPLSRRAIRRTPIAFGWLSKRPIPVAVMDDWFDALYGDPAVARDAAGFAAGLSGREMTAAAERLRTFPRPALMAWAPDDHFFPYSDGEKLAAMIPDCRVVPIHDSYTFTPIDQPDATAAAIVSFLQETDQSA